VTPVAAPAAAAVDPSSGERVRNATPAAWYALGVFTVVTLFAYVDRTIFALLAEPIRQTMSLSDLQLGLFQGAGLALFAALAYYPIGWLADRFDRRYVMIGGIALWSSAVVGCGLASEFWQLFTFSALVGVGEAALAPVFYSMIPELFRGDKRQLANSIFGVAASSAAGLALAISGQLPAFADALRPSLPAVLQEFETWRLSFFLAAAPAPVMMALIASVRLGGRRTPAAAAARSEAPLLPYLRREWRTLTPFIGGVALAVFGAQAVGSWSAVILMRLYGQTPAMVGGVLGPLTLAATAGGFALSLLVTRLFHRRLGPLLSLRALWLAYAAMGLGYLFAMTAPPVGLLYAISGVQLTLLTAANLLSPTAIQNLAPNPLRGRFIAVFFMVQLFSGAAAGPLVGLLSDRLGDAPNALLLAATGVGSASLVVAVILLRLAERTYAATLEANAHSDILSETS
jgi:MFS family permease